MTEKNKKKSFGERFAGVPPRQLGLKEASPSFRTAVWNLLHLLLFPAQVGSRMSEICGPSTFMTGLAREKRWNAADFALKNEYDLSKKLHKWILGEAEWHEIYDLLEQFPALAGIPDYRRDDWYRRFNLLLDDEGSPYRFISGELAPITSEEEVAAVAQAAGHAQPYDVASDHIQKALSLFARRPEPDRENTVKEAVSAFESALCIATDMNPGDMNATSKAFCAKFGTHKALMKSALNLFGFGGDAEGVRHAATSGESEVGPEEAQLVLVTASAWVNYIVRIATKAA